MNIIQQQTQRPYIHKYSFELRKIARKNWNDPYLLADILDELCCRRKKRAVNLKEQIVERLKELQKENFNWPSTEIISEFGKIVEINWPRKGLLATMNYRVGVKKGVSVEYRRPILDCIFKQIVPNVVSKEYMKQWGSPNTGKRLLKLARTIANFVKNAKRKNKESLETSIVEWESDLDYLKQKYYVGIYDFKFKWPRTDI